MNDTMLPLIATNQEHRLYCTMQFSCNLKLYWNIAMACWYVAVKYSDVLLKDHLQFEQVASIDRFYCHLIKLLDLRYCQFTILRYIRCDYEIKLLPQRYRHVLRSDVLYCHILLPACYHFLIFSIIMYTLNSVDIKIFCWDKQPTAASHTYAQFIMIQWDESCVLS